MAFSIWHYLKEETKMVFWVQLQCIVDVLQRVGSVAVAVLVMTCDRLHMTGDTWNVTGDRWQVTGDRWQWNKQKINPPISFFSLFSLQWWYYLHLLRDSGSPVDGIFVTHPSHFPWVNWAISKQMHNGRRGKYHCSSITILVEDVGNEWLLEDLCRLIRWRSLQNVTVGKTEERHRSLQLGETYRHISVALHCVKNHWRNWT